MPTVKLIEPRANAFPIEIAAMWIAVGAHGADVDNKGPQLRKYSGDYYIVHPKEVVQILESVGASPYLLAAGWLHDVIEDPRLREDYLRQFLPDKVVDLVLEVSDVSKPGDGNRATRKAIDREHLSKASPEGQTLKLADLISNSRSIAEGDPEFAKVYMREKKALLEVLTKGDPELYHRAKQILDSYFAA